MSINKKHIPFQYDFYDKEKSRYVIFESKLKNVIVLLLLPFLLWGTLIWVKENPSIWIIVVSTLISIIWLFGGIVILYTLINPNITYCSTSSKSYKEYFLPKIQEEALNEIIWYSNGFSLNSIDGVTHFWKDISTIIAYKKDLYTTDCICIEIYVNDEFCLYADEEMANYRLIIDHFTQNLTINNNWEKDVMFPPFATKTTIVYDKLGRDLDEISDAIS